MTPCARFAPMIGARPGELPPEDERALHEHLASCERCRARVADDEAVSGLVAEALLAEASRRDFSTFADGVLARIPAYAPGAEAALRPSTAGLRPSAQDERGPLARLTHWIRRHRAAALASFLAPAAVAAALVLYFTAGPGPVQQPALVEVVTEGGGTMVLETSDGPVVLIQTPAEGT